MNKRHNKKETLGLVRNPVSYEGFLGSSYQLKKNLSRIGKENPEVFKEKQRFRAMVSRLKKEGLIEKRGLIFSLTAKGFAFLKKPEKLGYKKEESSSVILVTFDIPEKMRRHRDWLRERLKRLDFNMLRQSVWIGTNKVPVEMIRDMRTAHILKYVDIVEITQKGTIEFNR